MGRKLYIIIGWVFPWLFLCTNAHGQVEHNYHVVSGFTDCDSLTLKGLEKDEAVKLLQNTRFRFQQDFRLTRKKGLKAGSYYSCDGKKGYLSIIFDDKKYLYINVPLKIWENFIKSADPEGYFLNDVKDKFSQYQ